MDLVSHHTRRSIQIAGAILAWFGVILQFILILHYRTTDFFSTIIRFFSYFTILTNMVVAVYYSFVRTSRFKVFHHFFSRASVASAIMVYITFVGIIYHLLLRHIWNPTGWQWIADHLLHSVVPLYYIGYWIFTVNKQTVSWHHIPAWMIYPAAYAVVMLIKGAVTNFYPYPFIDVSTLGYTQVFINTGGLVIAFAFLSAVVVGMAKWFKD